MNRTIEPSITLPQSLIIPEAKEIILDNGLLLYIINAGEEEVCRVEIIFNAGEIQCRFPLIASAVNDLLDEGTKTKTAFEIAEAFDFYGAYLQTESTADYASVKLFCLTKFLPQTLPLLNEIITEAIFPEKELDIYITQNKQKLLINSEKVDYLARKHFNKHIFGSNHPYGYFTEPQHYDDITRNKLIDFYALAYQPSNAFIVLAGKISEKETTEVNRVFGKQKFEKGNALPEKFQFPQLPAAQKIRIEKEGAVQSAIRIGKRMFTKSHPDYHSVSIASVVLGGYFGSRLMANIREEKGYTYGIGSALYSFKQDGFFFISTQVGKDVCEPAIAEIYKEVERLSSEIISTEELSLVKNYLFGNFQRSIDGPFAIADRFKSLKLANLDYDFYRKYLDVLKTFSAQNLLETASEYFEKKSLSEVIAG